MQSEWPQWLRWIWIYGINTVLATLGIILPCATFAKMRITVRKFFFSSLIMLSGRLLFAIFTIDVYRPPFWANWVPMAVNIMIFFTQFARRRRSDLLAFFKLFSYGIASDASILLFLTKFIPSDIRHSAWDTTSIWGPVIAAGISIAEISLWRLFVWLFSKRTEKHLAARLYASMSVIAVVSIVLPTIYTSQVEPSEIIGGNYLMNAMAYLAFMFLFLLGANYIISTLRYLREMEANRLLSQQQTIYESLVTEQRSYRHNLMNMLYGLEGALLYGDLQQVNDYYHNVITKTQRINNENILAIQNIRSLPVRGLLLHQAELALEAGVSMYIFVEPMERWCSMKDEALCEILGVLLDNARAAAIAAAAPVMIVEIRRLQGELEIVLRNTFAEIPDVKAMYVDGYTTKKDGAGLGLRSARRLLRMYPGSQLHFSVAGQYLIQQMLLV